MKKSAERTPINWRKSIIQGMKDLIFVVIMVTVIQVGLVQAYHVPTGSMEHTIVPGDVVIAEKVSLGPRTPHWIGIPYTQLGFHVPAVKLPGLRHVEPGDVVIVETPMDEMTPYVKRIAGTAGQTLEIRNKVLYVDGERAPDAMQGVHLDPRMMRYGFQQPGIAQELGNRDNWGPFIVPDGHVFLMGDNRDNSLDSRYFGPVPEEDVIGRVVGVAFSWDWAEFKDGPKLDRIAKAIE
jgi:signal peptidase I